jgi:integrase
VECDAGCKGPGAGQPLIASSVAALAGCLATRGSADGPLFHRLDLGSCLRRRATRGAGGAIPRLTVNGVYALVRRLGERADLAKPVAPHQLRHAAITTALKPPGRRPSSRKPQVPPTLSGAP